jgi:hypothetical protein
MGASGLRIWIWDADLLGCQAEFFKNMDGQET